MPNLYSKCHPYTTVIVIIIICIQDGVTPLGIASQKGHTAIVNALLGSGADPNFATKVSEII